MNLLANVDLPLFCQAWISMLTLGSVAFCTLLLVGLRSRSTSPDDDLQGDGPGDEHRIDGTPQPDRPLPLVWSLLFLLTLLVSMGQIVMSLSG